MIKNRNRYLTSIEANLNGWMDGFQNKFRRVAGDEQHVWTSSKLTIAFMNMQIIKHYKH